MADELHLVDPESLADLGRYAARARSVDEEGAMRLQGHGLVLAAWVGVLPGHGLMGDGTVLGLRTLALAEPSAGDVCVPVGAVADRTRRPGAGAVLSVPPTILTPQWAALTPPRTGWEPLGDVAADVLAGAARDGIAEIATGTPPGAGSAAVADLRRRVWGRPLRVEASGGEIPGGAGFAAYALGFLSPGGRARLARSGRWLRVSTPAGHVLVR